MSGETKDANLAEAPAEVVEEEGEPEPYPPWNFAWVAENELAIMAWPQNILNLEYLHDIGIRHLVTLSAEKIPPVEGYSKIEWTLIPVDEFAEPSLEQINKFIGICQSSMAKKQAVGCHCRMGHGRSGVMAACFLVKFKNMSPEDAIAEVRLPKENKIETLEQERCIFAYYNHIKGIQKNGPANNGTASKDNNN